jgi:parvulin-like peptidyl-prolyl isomerase
MSDQEIFDALLMEKLVNKEVAAQGLQAQESDIDSYIGRIQQQNNLTEEQMRQAMEAQGITWDLYRQQVASDIERAMLVNREIGSRVNVIPEDVERYYQEHLSDYPVPEQVRIRHLFLFLPDYMTGEEVQAVQKQMEEIYQRILAGEDFATLADTYSQGPGAGEGGDLGYFKKGSMTKEIEEVAFSLSAGEVSKPFRTGTGLHLIKVEEHHAADHRPLEEMEEEIRSKLYDEALQKRYQRWFQEDLRGRHHIELITSLDGEKTQSSLVAPPPQISPSTTEEEEKPSFLRRLVPFY